MKRKFLKASFCLVITVFIISSIGFSTTFAKIKKDYSDKLYIKLYGATYGDYDNDGRQDDIRCFMDVAYLVEANNKKYRVVISLITPDEQEYHYEIWVLVSFFETLQFQLLFYNHAKVSGIYTISADIVYYVPGLYFDSTQISFDPPSEKIPDSEPPSFTATLC